MRIEGQKRTASVKKAKTGAKSGSSSSDFELTESVETSSKGSAQEASDVGGLDALLALQSVEDPLFAKKKAVKRGRSMLDSLEALKVDLISGQVGEGHLNRLMALVGEARSKVDPKLQSVIEDIELRARVELAKLGRYPN